jgi:hypothetical protein
MSLIDICVETVGENVAKRKHVFRLKSTEVVDDYILLAESELSMQNWIQAIEDLIVDLIKNKRVVRKSLTTRNRSPSVQSPMTKNRKGSAGTKNLGQF